MKRGMTFSEFFHEIFDPMQGKEPTGELRGHGGSYEYIFTAGDDTYVVRFRSNPIMHGIREGYEIIFKGPEQTSLTGKGIAPTVYGEMLAGIKKFIDKADPEALYFMGANPAMDLVYHRMFNKFLKDKFVRVNETTYIRNDVLRNMPEQQKISIAASMANWQQYQGEFLRQRREDKVSKRKKFVELFKQVGKFFRDNHGLVGLITKVTSENLEYLVRVRYPDMLYPKKIRNMYIRPSTPFVEVDKMPVPEIMPLLELLFKPQNQDHLKSLPPQVANLLRDIYMREQQSSEKRIDDFLGDLERERQRGVA